ncbi:MAG: hypothetical protein MJ135_02930 [Oscillospiraceae bacterium]|nr:hypothetical protein [Oscillospiraceae bacterium]
MSTLEATVSMLEVLSEADLLRIQTFAKCLFMSQGHENPFQPLTKGQIIAQLDESAKEYAHGQFKDADAFADEMMEKYGL